MNKKEKILTAFLVILLILGFLLIIPSDYYLVAPGTAESIAPMLSVEGTSSYPVGEIMLTTVSVKEASVMEYFYVQLIEPELMKLRSKDVLPEGMDMEKYFEYMQEVMTESQLKAKAVALREAGYEFGNHSHSHDHFLNYSDEKTKEQFIEDLDKSEDILRRELGNKPDLYCYPYGEYNPDMQEILKERGYQAAAAQKSGVFYSGTDLFAIPRFPMTSTYGEIGKFQSKARMKALPVMKEEPDNTEIKKANPPQLTLQLDPEYINTDHIQCFVNGSKTCKISKQSNSHVTLKIQAKDKLRTRRTLYTVTAPSKTGSDWYWYSRLWVNTEYGE